MLLAGRAHGHSSAQNPSELHLPVISHLRLTDFHLSRAQILARQLLDLQSPQMEKGSDGVVSGTREAGLGTRDTGHGTREAGGER